MAAISRGEWWSIESALTIGTDLSSSHGYTEDDMRELWEQYGQQLIDDKLEERTQAGFIFAGHRPWGFWVFEVDRPDLAMHTLDQRVDQTRFLAEHGYLSEEEVGELVRRCREAAARVDTPAERYGPVWIDGTWVWKTPYQGDRLTVRIAEAAAS